MNLAPGVWTDDGTLHIDIDACLIGNGYEPNDENRQVLEEVWREKAGELGIDFLVEHEP